MATLQEAKSSTAPRALLPEVSVRSSGPASGALAERLRRYESRNVTRLTPDPPPFWVEARGGNVWDADGDRYLDLTGAFGVALAGHGHPRIVDAVREQAGRLMHGMGDVHPPSLKVELLERLARLSPWEEARGVLASTGSEAVEIALKTALLATGRPGILAFEGGYHGLTLGALAATARPHFREPFRSRVYEGVAWAPFPGRSRPDHGDRPDRGDRTDAGTAAVALDRVEALLRDGAPGDAPIGTVILEPVQGRAGVRIPPDGFLAGVAERARAHGALVVADEVFTGMGRCGAPLASTRLGLEPDIICVGKALGGGLPMSACLARAQVMDAWPPSDGEAVHTSTFLGHPLACRAALAVLDLVDEGLPGRAEAVGSALFGGLARRLREAPGVREVRGLGALGGIELARDGAAVDVAAEALGRGLIVLPAGDRGEVVELAPPACLTDPQVDYAVDALTEAVRAVPAGARP